MYRMQVLVRSRSALPAGTFAVPELSKGVAPARRQNFVWLTYVWPLQEAANENNFSLPNKRTLMAGLAVASAAHVAVLLPLLGTEKSGPLLFPVGFVWGVSAVASTLIAIKPKE